MIGQFEDFFLQFGINDHLGLTSFEKKEKRFYKSRKIKLMTDDPYQTLRQDQYNE